MKTKNTILILILLTIAAFISGVQADCSPAIITVNSPQNNHVYPSNSLIPLTFSLLPNSGFNFSSYSYSIDGKPQQPTNGSISISGLSDGSHTLTIYGNGSWHGEFGDANMRLEIVYFNVGYSTAMVNFTIGLIVFLTFFVLVFFVARKSLVERLKGKKHLSFWFGLMGLTIGVLVFVPSAWWYLDLYLFPVNFHGLVISPFMPLIFGGCLMTFGLALMIIGIRKKEIS